MKRLLTTILLLMGFAACGHKDDAGSQQGSPKPKTKVETITGFVEGPDGNYYEELKINDRRCTVAQYADDQTPSLDCGPPETTTTTFTIPGGYR